MGDGTGGGATGRGRGGGSGDGTGRGTGGGAGTAGRGSGGGSGGAGGGATGRGGATGWGSGAGGGATTTGAAVGRVVPQYPQNLLPSGNDLWHFGHITEGGAAGPGPRTAGVGGAGGADGAPACCGFPAPRAGGGSRRVHAPARCAPLVAYGSLLICVRIHILCSSRI